MPDLGVDASFTHQDAAQLQADHVKAVGRYCPGGGADPGKTLTAAELAALVAHLVAVWLVYELSAGRWRGGYAAGKADGYAARVAARAIGWPDDRPIYTGYDQNVGPADHDTAVAYQQGFNDGQAAAGARCGGAAYGDGYVLTTLRALGLIVFTWLSDSTAFTDSRTYAASGQASIVQLYGHSLPGLSGIDVDDLLVADFGQFPIVAHPIPQNPPRRRPVYSFFTINDAPASTGISHETVWGADLFEARPFRDMEEAHRWQLIALANGVPAGPINLTPPAQMAYADASRLRGVPQPH